MTTVLDKTSYWSCYSSWCVLLFHVTIFRLVSGEGGIVPVPDHCPFTLLFSKKQVMISQNIVSIRFSYKLHTNFVTS